MTELPKRLLYLRELHDLNQTAVAKMLNMSQVGYYVYETGRSSPSPETLVKLANFYNVSVDYLLGNEPEHKELDKFVKDFQSLPAERQEKVLEYVRLQKLDIAYQEAQKRRVEKKQQRLPKGSLEEPSPE